MRRRTLSCLMYTLFFVFIAYHWLDRPFAYFIFDNRINHFLFFKYLTDIAPLIYYSVLLICIYLCIRLWLRKFNFYDQILLTLALSTITAGFAKNCLKFLFGRTWPLTWINNNPSLINNHVYGFHLFAGLSKSFQSFPSGHATIIFSTMTVVWMSFPKLKPIAAILCAAVIVGLLALDYHFLSDVIAGAGLGIYIGLLFNSYSDQFFQWIRNKIEGSQAR